MRPIPHRERSLLPLDDFPPGGPGPLDDRTYAALIAIFAAVLHAAVVIAGFGVLSYLTDTDPVPEHDAGPVLGPVTIAVAFGAFLILLVRRGASAKREHISPLWSLLVAGIDTAAFLLAGAVGYATVTRSGVDGLIFIATQGRSFYPALVGISAFLISLMFTWVLASRRRDHGTPRWPWEHEDD